MYLGSFWLPRLRVFMVNDPVWVEKILIQEPHKYPKHRYMHEALEPLIGSSPFTTNGALWQRQRRMLDQAFEHARLRLVFPLMQQACVDMLSRLREHRTGAHLDVDQAMTHITADIIYRTIFSEVLSEGDAALIFSAFHRYQSLSQKAMVCRLLRLPPLWLNMSRRRQADVIRDFLSQKVAQRFAQIPDAQEQDGADILAGLRCAIDPVDGSRLTPAEVLDQICMLFLAGHETSASSLSWCLYLLGESPDLQRRLVQELHTIAPDGQLSHTDLRHLPQLTAVFREVLRLYPPVGYFPREATEAHEIRGKKVKAGDALLVFPWLLHRHRKWWLQPDEFLPERFAADRKESPTKGTYLPFGLGARACLGAGFAMQEAALILGMLLHEYEIEPAPGHEPRVVGRLTIRSDKGIKVYLRKRAA